MITRRALLIPVGKAPRERPIPGTYQDAVRMARYLQSVAGGAWSLETEICVLKDAYRADVLRGMRWLNEADASLVLFSGHGYERVCVSAGRYCTETRMICGDGRELTRDDLTPWVSRTVVILDSCRRPEVAKALVESALGDLVKAGQRRLTRAQARFLYDAVVKNAKLGTIYVHGCDFDQGANDGYSFTRALIEVSAAWSESAYVANGIGRLSHAFKAALPLLSFHAPGQRPTMDYTLSPTSFPFAIPSLLS